MQTSGVADYSVVPLCGRSVVVIRECFPEASKTIGKNEILDIERDWNSVWSSLVGWF